jgi:hypothetical protein
MKNEEVIELCLVVKEIRKRMRENERKVTTKMKNEEVIELCSVMKEIRKGNGGKL